MGRFRTTCGFVFLLSAVTAVWALCARTEASAPGCANCQAAETAPLSLLTAGQRRAAADGTAGGTTLIADATRLQSGTQSTTLQTGTQSTTLQTGTQSTVLKTGTESTLLEGGAAGALIQGQVERESGPVNILFLIDASYSMKEKLGGPVQKMDAAKEVLQNALARIPPDVNLGLRVFGQSFANDPMLDCQQSALLVPIGHGNRRAIIDQMRLIRPFGLTPLAYALRQAEYDLRGVRGPKTVILISDGAETCGGNPCEYVRRLNQIGIKIKVDIVGLGLKRDREARGQLNCIAEASGGKYYDANTAAELVESVSRSVSKAISGRVIVRGKENVQNVETPPDLAPIERVLPGK